MRTAFPNTKQCTRESTSFWRENLVAVVSLLRVLARMSQQRKQVVKCQKFYNFSLSDQERASPPSAEISLLTFVVKKGTVKLSGVSICRSLLTFVVKKGTVKLSGVSICRKQARKLKIKCRPSFSSSSSKRKLSNEINPSESYLTR